MREPITEPETTMLVVLSTLAGLQLFLEVEGGGQRGMSTKYAMIDDPSGLTACSILHVVDAMRPHSRRIGSSYVT